MDTSSPQLIVYYNFHKTLDETNNNIARAIL